MRSICVFCGSHVGRRAEYSQAVRQLATLLVGHKIQIIYGAGSIGLMGVLADEALKRGGRVVGVIPEHLCSKEVLHDRLSQLHVTDSLLERKLLMMKLSDGFIALPGGLGTFDELLEVYSWAQLGRHSKPIGILNTCGYFDPLLATIDYSIQEGFMRTDCRKLIIVNEDCQQLWKQMQRQESGLSIGF